MANKKNKKFPAMVVNVIDPYTVIINKRSLDDVQKRDKFSIYRLSDEEIKDPETGESLGKIEYFKGNGEIILVQERMSTIKSIEKKISSSKEITKYNDTVNSPFIMPIHPKEKIVESEEMGQS